MSAGMDGLTAAELYESLSPARTTRLLDVRNESEFAHWKVEGPGRIDVLNVPYFAFLEAENEAVDRVAQWLGAQPAHEPLTVVCAKGGSSEYVAELLRANGIAARNLTDGMLGWGRDTVAREVMPATAGGVRLFQILRFGKGCLSYVAAAGSDAVVVDPHRHVDGYRRFLDEHRLTARAVFDTHLHADHVSGGPVLARDTGAAYFAAAEDFRGAAFAFEPIDDGAPLRFGGMAIAPLVFLSVPGHTPGSTALRIGDDRLLTGDTLFVSSVGRPDLAGKAAEWGRELHATLHRRLAAVPDGALVLPAHTAGPREIGADGIVGARLGALRRGQKELLADEAAFLRQVMDEARPAPAAYEVIRAVNLGGRAADDEARSTLELGKNECALSREAVG
jgi:glyoxylase-like metal-dependent hydrolase (beta-lactamase superfamily II)